jgi:hypothetical protein
MMPITKFADRLNCDRSVVDSIFKHKSIDIDRLVLISEILNIDFIHKYCWKDTATGSDMHVIKEMIDSVGHIHKSVSNYKDYSLDFDANMLIIQKFFDSAEKKTQK